MEHVNSWRDSADVFKQQLSLNMRELQSSYPVHWRHLVKSLEFCDEMDIPVCLDVNYREQLWNPTEAKNTLEKPRPLGPRNKDQTRRLGKGRRQRVEWRKWH